MSFVGCRRVAAWLHVVQEERFGRHELYAKPSRPGVPDRGVVLNVRQCFIISPYNSELFPFFPAASEPGRDFRYRATARASLASRRNAGMGGRAFLPWWSIPVVRNLTIVSSLHLPARPLPVMSGDSS